MLGRGQSNNELRCSFCRKSQDTVGKLISSPSDDSRAFICDQCIVVCHSIIEDDRGPEGDPIAGNPLLDEFLAAVEQWIERESHGQDESEQLSTVRRLAHRMFDKSVLDSGQ